MAQHHRSATLLPTISSSGAELGSSPEEDDGQAEHQDDPSSFSRLRKPSGKRRPRPILDDDSVYLINAGEGSWCGCLSSDDEDIHGAELQAQIGLSLRRLKRQQDETSKESPADDMCRCCSDYTLGRRTDLERMSDTSRYIKQRLQEGITVRLERKYFLDKDSACAHQHCHVRQARHKPEHSLFLSQSSRQDDDLRYCLSCLEELWNNFSSVGSSGHQTATVQHYQARDMNLDGGGPPIEGPASLLASKHAPRPEQSPSNIDRCLLSGGPASPGNGRADSFVSSLSSKRSAMNARDSRHPTTLFQNLAPSIVPGATLTTSQKAALSLWKLATKQQLASALPDRDATTRRSSSIGADDNRMPTPRSRGEEDDDVAQMRHFMGMLDIDDHDDAPADNGLSEERKWCEESGITRRDCCGKDLSAVFAMLRC